MLTFALFLLVMAHNSSPFLITSREKPGMWTKPRGTPRNLTDPNGVFDSPNYPDQYPNSESQLYYITVPAGNYVHIDLFVFQLEENYDFLTVYDGPNEKSTKLVALTGNLTGSMYDSSGNTMTLLFQSDLTGTRNGFFIQYYAIPTGKKATPTYDCPDLFLPSILPYGVMTSPGFPNNYPDNYTCTYRLCMADHRVLLTFYTFDTEKSYDTLTIFDGPIIEGHQRDIYSGPSLPSDDDTQDAFSILSIQEEINLIFSSDLTRNFIGFSFAYRFIPTSEAKSIAALHPEGFPPQKMKDLSKIVPPKEPRDIKVSVIPNGNIGPIFHPKLVRSN